MKRWKFTCDYRSDAGSWSAGDDAELADDFAAWLDRDVPGCCVLADAPEPEPTERALDAPPTDRMQRRPSHKRGV